MFCGFWLIFTHSFSRVHERTCFRDSLVAFTLVFFDFITVPVAC